MNRRKDASTLSFTGRKKSTLKNQKMACRDDHRRGSEPRRAPQRTMQSGETFSKVWLAVVFAAGAGRVVSRFRTKKPGDEPGCRNPYLSAKYLLSRHRSSV